MGRQIKIEKVQLTDSEAELFALLTQLSAKTNWSPEDINGYSRESCKLFFSLQSRRAIPSIREQYFTDPAYVIIGKLSHKEIFEKNNGKGWENICKHRHFFPYLKYFIEGPDLPQDVIDAFLIMVNEEDYISGNDLIQSFKPFVRDAVRSHKLDPREVKDEFFKLALECNFHPGEARHIREWVMRVR